MTKISIKKLVFSYLLCTILTSHCLSINAEEINIEKINFQLGVDCLKKNDFRQAIKYFVLVIQKNPNNIEAHYNLGIAYKKSGMAEKSVSEFDNVVKLLNDPKNSQAKSVDINKLRQENRILHSNELASDKYALYSKVKSQENDYIDLGDMHYDNQQFETAVEYFNLALQINPYNDYTYFKIAKSYIDAKNYIQAEPYISKAVELSPQNPKYKYYKDLVVKTLGDKYVRSVDLREKIVNQALNRKDPMQGFDLPEEYKKELFAEEEKAIPVSDTPEPYIAEPQKTQVQPEVKTSKTLPVFSKKEKPQKPKMMASETTDINIDNRKNFTQGKSQELDYLDLADLHYDNQEYETAVEYYNLALGINSNNDYTYYKLARCFLDMKQYRNADENIDKALALSSMNKKYLYFKTEISNKTNPAQNYAIASKSPEDFSKNKLKPVANINEKLNPNLKMIPEDPKVIADNNYVDYKPDFNSEKPVKKQTAVKKPISEKFNTLISSLKPDFSLFRKQESPQKVAYNNQIEQPSKEIIKVKTTKTKQTRKNIDISEQQISSVETTPSIFGKDMSYYKTKEPDNTEEVNKTTENQFEKPMQEEPKEPEYSPDYYNEKGIEYFKRDNLPKAENFFKKAIELKPMYAKAYNNLANIEVRRDNLEKAIEYDLQAVQIDPSYPEAYYNLALIYKKKKDFINEIAYLDKTVQADPKYYQAYFNRGLAYYNNGDYEQAKYNFKEVLKYKNDHYLACQNLGIIYANELNKADAVNYLKTAIRLNKNNSTSYYYLAAVYQATGSVFDAIDNYQKTIKLDPANYKAYLALSKCYEQNDEIDRAIDTLNDAIQLNQSNAEPYNYLGLLYLKKDKYIEATNAFQKAISINPNRTVYHYNLSQSYICLNMKNKARSEFERATNIQPATIQDYIDLSEIFFDRSMPSYSIKVLKDGITALPDNDYLYVTLANYYEKTGAVNSAKKTLQDYLVKKPNGTLSLLIQRKLNTMENNGNSDN